MVLAYPKISPKILCIYLETFHSSLCHSLCTRLSPPYHNRLWTRWPPLYLYLHKHWTVTRIDLMISNPNPSFLLFINCHNIILFICSALSRAETYRFQLRNLEKENKNGTHQRWPQANCLRTTFCNGRRYHYAQPKDGMRCKKGYCHYIPLFGWKAKLHVINTRNPVEFWRKLQM